MKIPYYIWTNEIDSEFLLFFQFHFILFCIIKDDCVSFIYEDLHKNGFPYSYKRENVSCNVCHKSFECFETLKSFWHFGIWKFMMCANTGDDKKASEKSFLKNSLIKCHVQNLVSLGVVSDSGIRSIIFISLCCVMNLQQFIQIFVGSSEYAIFSSYFALTCFVVNAKSIYFKMYQKEYEIFLQYFDITMNDLKGNISENPCAVNAFKVKVIISINSSKIYVLQIYLQIRYAKILSKINSIICYLCVSMYATYSFMFPLESMEKPLMYDTWAPFQQFNSPAYELSIIFQVFVTYFCLVTFIAHTNVMFKLIVFGSIMFEMLQNDISSIFSEFYPATAIGNRSVVFIY